MLGAGEDNIVTRRVFVIWTHQLFHESVRLLLNHPEVEWVGETSDHQAAQEEIIKLKPDTILIEEVEEIEGSVPSEEMQILETCHWDVRVIGLNLTNNKLSVYHREQRTVRQAEDLLRLILSN